MKKSHGSISVTAYVLLLAISTLALFFIQPLAFADDYAQLKGCWQCQIDGESIALEFKSPQKLLFNGKAYNYQLAPGVIQVQEGYSLENYFFKMEGGILFVQSPDGSIMQCKRTKKPQQAKTKRKPITPSKQTPHLQSGDQGWPPPYIRPQGTINEQNPSAQVLLYKFSGRWANVTSNTLTNLLLKPDGTYEEAYEAGYSGVFKDQGGYQTGHWGATGVQQGRGHWKVAGSLRQGKLFLVDQNGRENVYTYQVHIRRGEIFWGEYFFNGRLYSVEYIYR
jgi:hypothetical protein